MISSVSKFKTLTLSTNLIYGQITAIVQQE